MTWTLVWVHGGEESRNAIRKGHVPGGVGRRGDSRSSCGGGGRAHGGGGDGRQRDFRRGCQELRGGHRSARELLSPFAERADQEDHRASRRSIEPGLLGRQV